MIHPIQYPDFCREAAMAARQLWVYGKGDPFPVLSAYIPMYRDIRRFWDVYYEKYKNHRIEAANRPGVTIPWTSPQIQAILMNTDFEGEPNAYEVAKGLGLA
jgi:hypothetical protein